MEETKPEKKQQISLRPFTVSDVDDFFVWASDSRVSQWCSWDTYTDKSDLLRYITHTVLPHPWFRAICIDGGRPIGAVSVFPLSDCRGELGYVLGSQYWGRGIVTAAVKMAVAAVSEEMEGMERIEALVDVNNSASQRVMEKAGFIKEGVLRKYCRIKGKTKDMIIYRFLIHSE